MRKIVEMIFWGRQELLIYLCLLGFFYLHLLDYKLKM